VCAGPAAYVWACRRTCNNIQSDLYKYSFHYTENRVERSAVCPAVIRAKIKRIILYCRKLLIILTLHVCDRKSDALPYSDKGFMTRPESPFHTVVKPVSHSGKGYTATPDGFSCNLIRAFSHHRPVVPAMKKVRECVATPFPGHSQILFRDSGLSRFCQGGIA